jgi:hypothetical protein
MDPELLRAAKVRAAEEGTTFTAIVERALRRMLNQPSARSRQRIPVRTYGSGGAAEGVNIEDNASVRALMDEDVDADSRR